MKKLLTFTGIIILLYIQPGHSEKPASDQSVLLKDGQIIDLVTNDVRTGDILIEGEKISLINTDQQNSLSADVTYDVSGHFIIPGLIDNHVHITHGSYDDAKELLILALKNGVTGVRDMGGDGRMLVSLKRNTLLKEFNGSDVYFSAIIAGEKFFENDPRPASVALGATAGQVPWQWSVNDKTDFDDIVAKSKGLGVTAIKIYTDVSPKQINKVTKAAKKQGLKVWAHAAIAPGRPIDIINSGADAVSHVGDFLQYQVVDVIKDRYAFKEPQDAQAYRDYVNSVDVEGKDPEVMKVIKGMLKNDTVMDATLWVYQRKGEETLNRAQQMTKLLYDNGVQIGAGSDNLASEGTVNLHTELELLVDAGLSNFDALKAATVVNANSIGVENEVGTIEEGKLANLVVLEKSPLESISNTRSIKYVIKRGKVINGESSVNKADANTEKNQAQIQ